MARWVLARSTIRNQAPARRCMVATVSLPQGGSPEAVLLHTSLPCSTAWPKNSYSLKMWSPPDRLPLLLRRSCRGSRALAVAEASAWRNSCPWTTGACRMRQPYGAAQPHGICAYARHMGGRSVSATRSPVHRHGRYDIRVVPRGAYRRTAELSGSPSRLRPHGTDGSAHH